jgi:hypothetical protein
MQIYVGRGGSDHESGTPRSSYGTVDNKAMITQTTISNLLRRVMGEIEYR